MIKKVKREGRVQFILALLERNRHLLISIFFSGTGLYLRFIRFLNRDLFVDEKVQINAVSGLLRPFWERTPIGCELTSFPGEYFVSTWPFTIIFGTNKWGLVIPRIIATVFGLYLLHLICKKYLKTTLAWAITFAVVCFNRELIYHSFEIRSYSVIPTLALASFYLSGLIVEEKGLGPWKKFFIGVLFLLTITYHAYGILIVGVSLLFFFFKAFLEGKSLEALSNSWKFLVFVFFLGMPLFFWYASGSLVDAEFCRRLGIHTFDFIPNPSENLVGFGRAILGSLVGNRVLYVFIIGMLFPFVVPKYKDRLVLISFLFLLVLLPIGLILSMDVINGYWFMQRQFVWIMPLFAFYLGWLWDSLFLKIIKK